MDTYKKIMDLENKMDSIFLSSLEAAGRDIVIDKVYNKATEIDEFINDICKDCNDEDKGRMGNMLTRMLMNRLKDNMIIRIRS